MADVFLGLAAAIVKACINVWSKDDPFAANIGSSVTDIVALKINDELNQRKISRFFEDLEEPIAKRLRSMRQTEFARLDENEWAAAILAAGDSFRRTSFTAKDLVIRNLDPLTLERHIRSANPTATRDLSADGTALYNRMITEAAAYVIEIVDKLPHFEAAAFTELLRRDQKILTLIDEVLDRIPKTVNHESEEERFAIACRRHIATKLDRLELHGLDFESSWYPLSVAYVSLRTEQELSSGSQAIEDRIASNTRTMLFGSAGSGKTTVLQWLAVSAARSTFGGALTGLNGYFPFLLRLRDFVGRKLPVPEEFLSPIAPMLVNETPPGWVRKQLDRGKALLLIDGVDELPESERPRVVVWLNDLVERFPRAIYVVTARPSAVPQSWLNDIGFVRSTLESMRPALVQAFVRNWHEAARQQMPDATERNNLEICERSLLREITKDRYLRDVADTPLLAGLLCALNRHLHSNLPRRRCEIYEHALMMSHQRDHRRGIAPGEVVLDLIDKNLMLADLALWMIRNGESEIDSPIAIKQIGKSLAVAGKPHADPARVLQFLLERSGLLREPSVNRIDFIHRTFQEYFAAKATVNGDFIGEMTRNAGNDQWNEVVIFTAGQANQVQASQLIRGLLQRDNDRRRYKRHVLAVACLSEVRGLDYDLRRQVESVIPKILPPESMEQAEQLSTAGNLLIQPLARYWAKHVDKAAETVRAASLIGTPAAMNIIRDVVSHPKLRNNISAELCRAWQYFEADPYAQEILARSGIRELSLDTAAQLDAARYVDTAIELNVALYEGERYDLSRLGEISRLSTVTLNFSGSRIMASWGGACEGIEDLRLYNFPRRDLSMLPLMDKLRRLTISQADNLIDLSGIENANNNLDTLDIADSCRLISLRELNICASLRTLRISNSHYLDLDGFIPPSGLIIHLDDCEGVDVSPLAGADDLCIRLGKNTWLENTDRLFRLRVERMLFLDKLEMRVTSKPGTTPSARLAR